MALIKCPECGKEISDKANACPNCGCPINDNVDKDESSRQLEISENTISQLDKRQNQNRKINFKLLISLVAIIVIIFVGGGLYYNNTLKPQKIYNEALTLLNKGKYTEANQNLAKISTYKNVPNLQQEIKYESRVYMCIKILKPILKNYDSLQITDVSFYQAKDNTSSLTDTSSQLSSEDKKNLEKYPTCVLSFNAQNGFGGNTPSYGVFMYSNDKKSYDLLGICNSLNTEENKDNLSQDLACVLLNTLPITSNKIGKVDLDRIRTNLKNNSYSSIKIIG